MILTISANPDGTTSVDGRSYDFPVDGDAISTKHRAPGRASLRARARKAFLADPSAMAFARQWLSNNVIYGVPLTDAEVAHQVSAYYEGGVAKFLTIKYRQAFHANASLEDARTLELSRS